MKKVLFTLCCGVLLMASCQEKAPPIDFSGPRVAADTTYVISPVPATDPHNVLIEEFTGQTCPNCPEAHEKLKAMPNQGRMNVISLYMWNMLQTIPVEDSKNDFRDKDSIASKISSQIYAGGPASGIPCGGVDRVPKGGVLQLYASEWSAAINTRMAIEDSLNLALSSSYNAADSVATITATITYTKQVSTKQSLSLVIVEDSIIDKQEFPFGVEEHYVFLNVFRTMITSVPFGDPLITAVAVKEPGRVNVRTYKYKVSPSLWNVNHCRVIGWVHYSASEPTKDVMQSAQTKLAP